MKEIKIKFTVNSITISLIYLIAFYSTFKNSTIYILGAQLNIRLFLDVIYLFLLMVTLFLELFMKFKGHKVNNSIKYILPLLIWVLVQSISTSIIIGENWIPIFLLNSILTTVVIILGLKTKEQLIKVIWCCGFGLAFSSMIPLIMFPELIGTRVLFYNGVNYSGSFWNFPLISFVSIAWILLSVVNMKNTPYSKKILGYSIFIVGLVACFSGLSRIFLVMTIASLCTIFITTKGLKTFIKGFLLVVFLFVMVRILEPEIIQSFQLRLSSLNVENISDEARISIWKGFINNIDKYFLWGATTDYRTLGEVGVFAGPHSSFLNWLVQYGIIGLLAFLFLLFGVLREIIRIKKISQETYSYFVAWFIAYLTLITVNETGFAEPGIYAGIGIILSYRNIISS